MVLSSVFSFGVKASFSDQTVLIAQSSQVIDAAKRFNFKDGTGAGQVDRIFANRYTLAAAGTQSLDLAGVLLDYRGIAITMAKVRGIYVAADDANGTNVLTLTRPASNGVPIYIAAGDGDDYAAGDTRMWASKTGRAVTAGTGDLLLITNTGTGNATVEIVIVGTSV